MNGDLRMFIEDYFSFSKSQTRGILVLFSCILIVGILNYKIPIWFNKNKKTPSPALTRLISLIEMDSSSSGDYYPNNYASKYKALKLTPFKFNPNTLNETGFKKLGLRDKLVATLLNYRNKGGKFYNKESLKRIYGLHEDEYKQLEPYIDIPNSVSFHKEYKKPDIIRIELNSADTSQLIRLRGIGAKLSMNIIRLREQLGGFVRIEQIKEAYGISESTFDMIKSSLYINHTLIKTISLNEATLYELNAHPYLRGDLARALVEFRKSQHYKIDNLNQIKEIPLINEEIFRKIVPYLRI